MLYVTSWDIVEGSMLGVTLRCLSWSRKDMLHVTSWDIVEGEMFGVTLGSLSWSSKDVACYVMGYG